MICIKKLSVRLRCIIASILLVSGVFCAWILKIRPAQELKHNVLYPFSVSTIPVGNKAFNSAAQPRSRTINAVDIYQQRDSFFVGLSGKFIPEAADYLGILDIEIKEINALAREAAAKISQFELNSMETILLPDGGVRLKCPPNEEIIVKSLNELRVKIEHVLPLDKAELVVSCLESSQCFLKSSVTMVHEAAVESDKLNIRTYPENTKVLHSYITEDGGLRIPLPSISELFAGKGTGRLPTDSVLSLSLSNVPLLEDLIPRWGHIFAKAANIPTSTSTAESSE
jgi:hypothetical protein